MNKEQPNETFHRIANAPGELHVIGNQVRTKDETL